MVTIVQNPEPKRQKRAFILTVKTRRGMMRHVFISDIKLPLENPSIVGLEGEFATGEAVIRELERQDRLIAKTTLYEIAHAILEQLQQKHDRDLLAAQGGPES